MRRALGILVLLVSCGSTSGTATQNFAGGLADYSLPPGAVNPTVTQATIGSTICVSGWTATVRPGTSFTTPLKNLQMKERHLPGKASDYEEDHLIPLELGGAPADPKNLWPEARTGPHASAGDKDRAENAFRSQVCAGTLSLADARARIVDPAFWDGK